MFAETWRRHWGLEQDPFAHEDADKDPVLSRVDSRAVHSCFDRVYGDPGTPGPGIVFGEKGSGKSGLRLAVQRHLDAHNEAHPDAAVFRIEYSEFDVYLDNFRRAAHISGRASKTPLELIDRWRLSDHLDGILSLGVTTLFDELIEGKRSPKGMTRKQKLDALCLGALYYDSGKAATGDALTRARRRMRYSSARPGLLHLVRMLLVVLGVVLGLVPLWNALEIGPTWESGSALLWYACGGVVLFGTALWTLIERSRVRSRAQRAMRAVRVLLRDPAPLAALLETVSSDARKELVLPIEGNEATRYHLLQRFLTTLEAFGYHGVYILIDRVDESTLLAGREEWTRPLVEKLLDHKLLQHPGLAFKLFLPIELSKMVLGASPDDLKRMRLDKSNTVHELRWTGQEIVEIANQRLAASGDAASPRRLADFCAEDLSPDHVRETLNELGTPRHAFGFLSTLFAEYARNLPEELEATDAAWNIPLAHFDVVRASWLDKSRVLRRTLN